MNWLMEKINELPASFFVRLRPPSCNMLEGNERRVFSKDLFDLVLGLSRWQICHIRALLPLKTPFFRQFRWPKKCIAHWQLTKAIYSTSIAILSTVLVYCTLYSNDRPKFERFIIFLFVDYMLLRSEWTVNKFLPEEHKRSKIMCCFFIWLLANVSHLIYTS